MFAFITVRKIAVLSVVLYLALPVRLEAANGTIVNQKFYDRALKKGIEDCKNQEIKLGMLSLRIAEFSSSSNQKWSKVKFTSLLCLSEGEMSKSFFSELNSIDSSNFEVSFRRKINLLKAISGYEGLTFTNSDDFQRIEFWKKSENLEALNKASLTNTRESVLIEKAKNESGVNQFFYRSPLLLGMSCSILPGLGQAIQGNWGSGGIAFFLSALLLGTTIEFPNRGQVFTAGTSGLVFSMVYVGNIVNAAHQAAIYNESKTKKFRKSLKWSLFPELRLEF